MAENRNSKAETTVYDRLKNKLLNNWVAASITILALIIVFSANMIEKLFNLSERIAEKPDITLLSTVSDSTGVCGPIPAKEGEEVMFQRSIIDFSINNQTDRVQVIRSAILKPVGIKPGFWAGETGVKEAYDVNLDSWYVFSMDALLKKSTIVDKQVLWFEPPPIEVAAMVESKYQIKAGEHERIHLKLGLTEGNQFLYGTVKLLIETDAGAKLNSDPLWITVCTVDPVITDGYESFVRRTTGAGSPK